jgi:ElaB/YqjD/DUF883 family membrane-anchored ribosome-binding protein
MAQAAEAPARARDKENGEDLREDLMALRSDMSKLMRELGRSTRHRVGHGVESGARFAEEGLSDVTERSRGYVRDYPLAACAAAAALGFAVAIWMKR